MESRTSLMRVLLVVLYSLAIGQGNKYIKVQSADQGDVDSGYAKNIGVNGFIPTYREERRCACKIR